MATGESETHQLEREARRLERFVTWDHLDHAVRDRLRFRFDVERERFGRGARLDRGGNGREPLLLPFQLLGGSLFRRLDEAERVACSELSHLPPIRLNDSKHADQATL